MPAPTLRDQMLNLAQSSGASSQEIVQAAVDMLLVSVLATSGNVEMAQRNIDVIARVLAGNVREAYREYHAEAALQRRRRQ